MPYLPSLDAEQTVFPKTGGKDLAMQIRMIEDLYRSQYPATSYWQLKKSTTPMTVTATKDRTIVGAAGTTKFDPIWGEKVDPNMVEWTQGHASDGSIKTAETALFYPPLQVHSRRQRISKDTELKKYGFDKVRELLIFIPCSILDSQGITVTVGDKFIWNRGTYKVEECNLNGYWKNSDVALYVVINADNYRVGS